MDLTYVALFIAVASWGPWIYVWLRGWVPRSSVPPAGPRIFTALRKANPRDFESSPTPLPAHLNDGERTIVTAYLRLKSAVKVATQLEVSLQAVDAALVRSGIRLKSKF